MFALAVRFDLLPGTGREFDRLVNETLAGIRANEPGTLLYLCHEVTDTPDSRVFYELYRDAGAFEEHERQPHVRRFLTEREKFLARAPRVDRLSSLAGKGIELD
jgi:quinol monooxygenase YgiN